MLGKIEGGRRRGRESMRCWMASPPQWTWVLVDSRSWWWTVRPGVLWFMGSQIVEHDWATELNWTERILNFEAYAPLPRHQLLPMFVSRWTQLVLREAREPSVRTVLIFLYRLTYLHLSHLESLPCAFTRKGLAFDFSLGPSFPLTYATNILDAPYQTCHHFFSF